MDLSPHHLLVGGTRPEWPEANGTIWILRSDLVKAVESISFGLAGDVLGDLARAYSASLSASASRAGPGEDGTA